MLSSATKAAAGVTKALAEHDVRSKLDRSLDRAGEEARHVVDDLSDRANEAGAKVRHLFDGASERVSHASDRLNREVHDNPVRSTLVALGAGVVLGYLLRR